MAAEAKFIYKSKISWGLVLFIFLALAIPLGFMLAEGVWLGIVLVLLTALLPLSIFRNTYYEINGGDLVITSGFLVKQTIPIASIRSVKPSRNLIASPALSLDRQEIKFGRYDFVLISLKDIDKPRFYAELKSRNPGIVF
jgi:hypothetical protein